MRRFERRGKLEANLCFRDDKKLLCPDRVGCEFLGRVEAIDLGNIEPANIARLRARLRFAGNEARCKNRNDETLAGNFDLTLACTSENFDL